MLKDKLRPITIFKSLFGQNPKLSSTRLEVVRHAPPTGARGRTFCGSKARKLFDWLRGYFEKA